MLKSTVDTHLSIISKIIDYSFENGCFPGELKLAEVSPIFRKNEDVDKKIIGRYVLYLMCQKSLKGLFTSKLILS